MKINCAFLIFDGFSNFILASAIEPLRVAQDSVAGANFSWRLFSIDGEDVRSSSGLKLRCDGSLMDMGEVDILFVVAGYDIRDKQQTQILQRLQQAARHAHMLAALDSGAWLLAAAGLLAGHRATIHWQNITYFAEAYLDVKVVNEHYVIDRGRISAGDAMAVLELMLHLITEEAGRAVAFEVHAMFSRDSGNLMINRQDGTISNTSPQDPHALRAVQLMRQNIEHPLSLTTIAKAVAMAPRSLSRLFAREFGTSPGHFYETVRLDSARVLVRETCLSASEIAARTGYASSSCLSRAFHRHFGQTLRDLRRESVI